MKQRIDLYGRLTTRYSWWTHA